MMDTWTPKIDVHIHPRINDLLKWDCQSIRCMAWNMIIVNIVMPTVRTAKIQKSEASTKRVFSIASEVLSVSTRLELKMVYKSNEVSSRVSELLIVNRI